MVEENGGSCSPDDLLGRLVSSGETEAQKWRCSVAIEAAIELPLTQQPLTPVQPAWKVLMRLQLYPPQAA